MKTIGLINQGIYLLSTFLSVLLLFSCGGTEKQEIAAEIPAKKKLKVPNTKFHTLEKMFVVGNFTGNQKNDTIFQCNYSNLNHAEIDSAADPFQQSWESVIEWFYKQDAQVYLTTKRAVDTLYLGPAQGLYCLINIGDNNSDGKDEIALVIDYLDFSNVNSCNIYSLCNNRWVLLKTFGVHEDAFTYRDKEPVFKEIKDYLERQGRNWLFRDYSEIGYDSAEEVGKMKKLQISKCNSLSR